MPQTQLSDPADRELIRSLSDRFRPALYRYFRRRKLPARDIEDVIQEVFMRLSRRRGLAGMENIPGYLFETAASVAIDYLRRATVRCNLTHEPYDDQVHAVADTATDLILEGKEALRLLSQGLLELPERTRNCFILARFEQMRHAEIAQRLGITVSAVEKHVVKAVTHLIARVRQLT